MSRYTTFNNQLHNNYGSDFIFKSLLIVVVHEAGYGISFFPAGPGFARTLFSFRAFSLTPISEDPEFRPISPLSDVVD